LDDSYLLDSLVRKPQVSSGKSEAIILRSHFAGQGMVASKPLCVCSTWLCTPDGGEVFDPAILRRVPKRGVKQGGYCHLWVGRLHAMIAILGEMENI